jgi:hypothetical protein
VTVLTTHFSDWALAVTDPQELADEEAMDRQLSRTLGGKLGALIAGDQDSLDCSPQNLLLAAQMSDDTALTPKLCEEVLPDGSYRLQYVNTTGTPQLIKLPDGFSQHDPSRELDPLLAIPDLMKLARGEAAGLPQALFSAAGMDTTLTIIPVRVMDFAEASALPAPDFGDVSECQAPPAGVPLPARAPPGIQCLAAVKADLDGNGTPDRLLLWESRAPDDIGGELGDQAPQVGAVAYLADGTFHLLEESAASWQLPGLTRLEELHPAQVVSLGDDRRQQVLATVTVGANTTWQVILTVGTDHRLHALRASDGTTVALAGGGGTGYSSGYGCVDSHGQPLVAYESTETQRSPDGVDQGYSWSTGYFRLRDLQWTHVATVTGRKSAGHTVKLNVGSDCSNPDPTRRGPEIGTP